MVLSLQEQQRIESVEYGLQQLEGKVYQYSFLAGQGMTGANTLQSGYLQSGNFVQSSSGFKFTAEGIIYAVGAVISGSITATSGAIGGWSINATSIYTGTEDHSAYTANAGDMTLYSNGTDSSIHAFNWYIGTDGSFNVRSGVISGASIASVPNDTATDISLLEKTWTMVFSVTDADTITWTSGTVTLSNGRTFSISSGNTGNMAALTYIYIDPGVSSTVLQTTTTASTALGANKCLIGTAQNNTVTASFIPYGPGQPLVDGANIGALSITAGNIAASTITAGKLNVTTLSAITADMGSLTTGTIGLDSGTSYIKSGATAYNSGTGFWLERNGGTPRFFIGNSAGNKLTWDGTTLSITGSLTATAGTIGGWSINSTSIYTGTEDHTGYTTNSGDITIYSNGTDASIHGFNFYIDTTGKFFNKSGDIGSWVVSSSTIEDSNARIIFNGGDPSIRVTGAGSEGYIGVGAATAPTTGNGIYLGTDGLGNGDYDFRAGDPAGVYMHWDDSAGTLKVEGGSVNVGTTGNLRGGQTAYNTGTGFFLGYESGAHKFSLGNPSGNYITWDGTTLTIVGNQVQVTTYTSGSGNWTKPTGTNMVYVQLWGGGGGGGGCSANTNYGGGGGGGAYTEHFYKGADVSSTAAYSVGAGGAGSSGAGSAGGDSTFAGTSITITAYGGGGGGGGDNAGSGFGGGGGGGAKSAGASVGSTSGGAGGGPVAGAGGSGATPPTASNFGGGGGGSSNAAGDNGAESALGGGGGGGSSSTSGVGGDSWKGGGGGGGQGGSTVGGGGAGGTSTFGGAGGAGSGGSGNTGVAGTAPGGGGGGAGGAAAVASGGAGGAGRIIVTAFL